MLRDSVLSFVRHLLTFGGGFVVAKGWVDTGTLELAVGAVVTLAGIAWGIFDKASKPAITEVK
jgi:hypothetical protein